MFKVRVHKVQRFRSAEPKNRIAKIPPGESLTARYHSPKRPLELGPPLHSGQGADWQAGAIFLRTGGSISRFHSSVFKARKQEHSTQLTPDYTSFSRIFMQTGKVSQSSFCKSPCARTTVYLKGQMRNYSSQVPSESRGGAGRKCSHWQTCAGTRDGSDTVPPLVLAKAEELLFAAPPHGHSQRSREVGGAQPLGSRQSGGGPGWRDKQMAQTHRPFIREGKLLPFQSRIPSSGLRRASAAKRSVASRHWRSENSEGTTWPYSGGQRSHDEFQDVQIRDPEMASWRRMQLLLEVLQSTQHDDKAFREAKCVDRLNRRGSEPGDLYKPR
ncbi:uncharacterized protein LOC123814991 [Phyllostomus hastatus]|uniref:uncharacterized protein LOC123814991 n=1 Tax=Phyllostomus hastatus TaxID=9423 RepID=UPI001E67FE06|nr:uncharacterized protein LOC123814991 [Phyllostomus hastatus]